MAALPQGMRTQVPACLQSRKAVPPHQSILEGQIKRKIVDRNVLGHAGPDIASSGAVCGAERAGEQSSSCIAGSGVYPPVDWSTDTWTSVSWIRVPIRALHGQLLILHSNVSSKSSSACQGAESSLRNGNVRQQSTCAFVKTFASTYSGGMRCCGLSGCT